MMFVAGFLAGVLVAGVGIFLAAVFLLPEDED